MEPSFVNVQLIASLAHGDLLEVPEGVKRLAEAAADEKRPIETRRALAALLAFTPRPAEASKAIVAARKAATDPHVRIYLQVALGGAESPEARELVFKGFEDDD